ncbi:hypothetical protein NKI89_03275 [Mesorhizobium sp. M0309]|uniref:hypothetical protein n=1 Tax=Mesorhizobium sp. M0309 TaxID=2956933 RepID=UPI00333674F4
MALALDATLADVTPKHPATYYPPLIKRLNECASGHGSAYVRIGTDGSGTAPYYLISADEEGKQIFGAFDYGHPFTPSSDGTHWSTKPMGIHEVVALAVPYITSTA